MNQVTIANCSGVSATMSGRRLLAFWPLCPLSVAPPDWFTSPAVPRHDIQLSADGAITNTWRNLRGTPYVLPLSASEHYTVCHVRFGSILLKKAGNCASRGDTFRVDGVVRRHLSL